MKILLDENLPLALLRSLHTDGLSQVGVAASRTKRFSRRVYAARHASRVTTWLSSHQQPPVGTAESYASSRMSGLVFARKARSNVTNVSSPDAANAAR